MCVGIIDRKQRRRVCVRVQCPCEQDGVEVSRSATGYHYHYQAVAALFCDQSLANVDARRNFLLAYFL